MSQMTLRDIAEKTGRGYSTLANYAKQGLLEPVGKGFKGKLLFDPAAVEVALRKIPARKGPKGLAIKGTKATPEPARTPARARESKGFDHYLTVARQAACKAFQEAALEGVKACRASGDHESAAGLLEAVVEIQRELLAEQGGA